MKKSFYNYSAILFLIVFLEMFSPFFVNNALGSTPQLEITTFDWQVEDVKIEPTLIFPKENMNVSFRIKMTMKTLHSLSQSFTSFCKYITRCLEEVKLSIISDPFASFSFLDPCCISLYANFDKMLNRCVGSNTLFCDYSVNAMIDDIDEKNLPLELSVYVEGKLVELSSISTIIPTKTKIEDVSTLVGKIKVIKKPEPSSLKDENKLNPLAVVDLEEFIEKISGLVYWIATGILVLVILMSGTMILISAGDPSKIQHGKNILFYALMGFALMTMSKGVIDLVLLVIGAKK